MCESIRPGTTVRPSRSIMRVPAPASARMSAERADRDDLAVAHGERLGCRRGRVEGHDLAVEQDGVGVLAEGGRRKALPWTAPPRRAAAMMRFHCGTSRCAVLHRDCPGEAMIFAKRSATSAGVAVIRRDDLVDGFARDRRDIQIGFFCVGQERRIRRERRERGAQRIEPLRWNARRGNHRPRDGLLRKEQFHHLAVRVGLHEVERGRQVRQIGIALQRALYQQGHLLVAQPIGPLLLEAGP